MTYMSVKIVFICHNLESVEKVIEQNIFVNEYSIIYVGEFDAPEIVKTNPNVIIAKSFSNNIEHEPKLLSFTAWYLIVKNELFLEYEYICLLEWDAFTMFGFHENLTEICSTLKHDMVSFNKITSSGSIFWEVVPYIMMSFLKDKIDINKNQLNQLTWYHSSNQCVRRRLLTNFVDWYYPDCLQIKKMDITKFSYYHERLFSIYCIHNKYNVHVTSGITHESSFTHKNTCNHDYLLLRKQRVHNIQKYFVIYNDGTHISHINKLIESINKYCDCNIIVTDKEDIDNAFYEKNYKILSAPRGGGYWLWKPYIINSLQKHVGENSYIFYIDAKYYFLEEFHDLFMNHLKTNDILVWGNKPNEPQHLMKNWCKMDVVHKYDMIDKVFNQNAQDCWAGAICLKNNANSKKMVSEWLEMCYNYNDISDSPSVLPESELFREHRHDQSLLSIVLHKHNVELQRFPNKYLQNVRNPY